MYIVYCPLLFVDDMELVILLPIMNLESVRLYIPMFHKNNTILST